MESSTRWRDYQEDVANFFRQLGCDVEVDARVQGWRFENLNVDHNLSNLRPGGIGQKMEGKR